MNGAKDEERGRRLLEGPGGGPHCDPTVKAAADRPGEWVRLAGPRGGADAASRHARKQVEGLGERIQEEGTGR